MFSQGVVDEWGLSVFRVCHGWHPTDLSDSVAPTVSDASMVFYVPTSTSENRLSDSSPIVINLV